MNNNTNVNNNAIYNTIKSICGIIYPLITFPYISRILMAENVGKVTFANSVVSYFSLIASLGVSTYAIRECSRVREDRDELGRVSSQIFSINIMSTLIAYVALAITLVAARPLDNYRTLICIQSASILFTTLGADWLNTAMEDFRYITLRTVAMQVVSLVLMFIFVRHPEDYIIYAIISVVASSGANIINIFYRSKYCSTRFVFAMNVKKHLPPILVLFSMILSQTIYCNSDMTMLGLMRSDYEVGLYSTSVKIYNLVNTLVASVAWVVMPGLSHGFAKKDYTEINRLLKYSLNYIIVLGLPCLAGLNVIGRSIIYVLAGEEYLGAVTSLHILTLSLAASFIGGWIGNMMLLPAGKERITLIASVISAVENVVLNLILIPKYGLNAAAFTTVVSEVTGVIFSSRFVDRNVRIDRLCDMLKAPVMGTVAIVLIGIAMKSVFSSEYLQFLSAIILSVIAYTGILVGMKNEFALGLLEPVFKRIRR